VSRRHARATVVIACAAAVVLLAGCRPSTVPPPNKQLPPTPGELPQTSIETVAEGMDTLWAIDFAPDGRIFLTERAGQVRVIKDGRLSPEPWITIPTAEVSEAGLLGLALDPAFGANGFVYVAYTYRADDGSLKNRLVRLRENANGKGVVDRVLLDGIPGTANHDGGRVQFGPDGKLYWTIGDAQQAERAQDLRSLNGKILRLNPDGSIPTDNPFPDSPVYSYGHRNPQGLAWQPATGRLYATEHGPSGADSGRDEVNYIEPGKNYGWPLITGNETRQGMVSPILQSGDTETWAPAGAAFITQGPWAGSLLFVGLRGETLYRLVPDVSNPRKIVTFDRLFAGEYGRLRDVAQGPDGSIYLLTSNRDGRGSPRPGDDRVLRLTVR